MTLAGGSDAPGRPGGSVILRHVTAALDLELPVRLLRPGARPPARTRPGDAGYDLRCLEAFTLAAGERRMVPTGIALALPPGVAGLVTPRSGLALWLGGTRSTRPGRFAPNTA